MQVKCTHLIALQFIFQIAFQLVFHPKCVKERPLPGIVILWFYDLFYATLLHTVMQKSFLPTNISSHPIVRKCITLVLY